MSLGAASSAPAQVQGRDSSVHHRFMTFFLNDRTYGLPLHHVAEITPFRDLNKLPHMPRAVEGILDLRGRVVPVVNLRLRMSMPPLEEGRIGTILVLDLAGTATGLLVDAVDAVVNIPESDMVPASPLLAGLDGAWVEGFIVQGEKVVTLLDAALVANHGIGRAHGKEILKDIGLEERLDDGLRRLIEMAPPKEQGEHRVLPQIESSISYTEQEMGKVMERVEGMLASTDKFFQGLGYLKQEAGLGRLKGHERDIAELDRINQEMQDTVFALIQQMQFQDIARQKLERVMAHLKGMQVAISGKFRATKQAE
ncbi:chemotaxis protein CheW [Geothrix sp. PMB-07]|uniref:chemotaxis protein CheW n=1 Tax=Geothrix sp. PMB-07 TaxID=3068640 RepID=UPI002740BD8C|nr:chemotaxis protein CheW [Geothrix sp. PMB-07]WLT30726.1 chemotaxis protein CheW [Geothrix sp. PMB-07]